MCCWRAWSPLSGGIWFHSLQLLMGLSRTGFLGAVKGGQRVPKGQEDKGVSEKKEEEKGLRKGTLKARSGGLCVLMHLKEKQCKALCTMPCGFVCVCQIIMVITIFLLEEDCSYSKNYVMVQTHCFPSLRFQLLKLPWIFIFVVSGMFLPTFFSLSFLNSSFFIFYFIFYFIFPNTIYSLYAFFHLHPHPPIFLSVNKTLVFIQIWYFTLPLPSLLPCLLERCKNLHIYC